MMRITETQVRRIVFSDANLEVVSAKENKTLTLVQTICSTKYPILVRTSLDRRTV